MRELRALVVDDSSLNRRTIAAILKEIPGVTHVDVANDGADALRVVETNPPDFITLDLEMPRLDGYEFLQLLMDRHPLPVVVVSGLSAKENVFRALELGAIDFLEKPQGVDAPLESLRRQLVEKVKVVQQLSPVALRTNTRGDLAVEAEPPQTPTGLPEPSVIKRVPSKVIVIGASTGGPRALVTLFRHLHGDVDAALVIAQHMPPRFTTHVREPPRSGQGWCRCRRPGSTSASRAGMPTSVLEGDVSRSSPPIGGRRYASSRLTKARTMFLPRTSFSNLPRVCSATRRLRWCSPGWETTARTGYATFPSEGAPYSSRHPRRPSLRECRSPRSGLGCLTIHWGFGHSAT